MTGRTTWWPKDAAWHRRELIVELGDEFGAEGPNVMDVLSAWAQEQREAGKVRGGFRALAREAFVTLSHAQFIVARAGEIGALDEVEIDPDGRRFRCRVSGWDSDQARGRAAFRKQNQRFRENESQEESPESDLSRSVTPSALPNLTKEEITPPTPPEGGRRRDQLAFEKDLQAYTTALGIEHPDGWFNVKAAIQSGGATTNDEVLAWVQKWRPDVMPSEAAA